MKLFGIAGWSGSGKTTLIRALIPVLSARGCVVGTVKHSHHDLTLEAEAAIPGAVETLMAGPDRVSLVGTVCPGPPRMLPFLASRLRGIDLLLVEGFKFYHHPRLEVWNSTLDKPMLVLGDQRITALVSDGSRPPILPPSVKWFHRDDAEGIAEFIQKGCVSLDELRC